MNILKQGTGVIGFKPAKAGIEFYISIIGPQSSSEHVYLGLTDIGLREGHLPGQVTALDHVIVH